MLKQVYFGRVKEVGGSNPSGFELQVALDTMPSIDKNPDAALVILERDKKIALKNIFKYKKTEEALRNSRYQMSPDDESILANSEQQFEDFINKRNKSTTTNNSNSEQQQGQNNSGQKDANSSDKWFEK